MTINELSVQLRDVSGEDLPVFFQHQIDPEANEMAAFPPRDKEAFMIHWNENILGGKKVTSKTILVNKNVAGHIVSWNSDGLQYIGYWLGREYWGKGITTSALTRFLLLLKIRPLYAHVAINNVASIRVLRKCGFFRKDKLKKPSNQHNDPVDEYLMILE